MNPDTKRRLFVSTVEDVFFYGCETWTLTLADEKALDGFIHQTDKEGFQYVMGRACEECGFVWEPVPID